MLVVDTFANKAAVQSAVTTAIANAKVDSDSRAAEAALVLAYTNAADAAAFVTLLDANALALDVTNYAGLDSTGKTAVGSAMLVVDTFANKAVVQSAVTTAIANAKVDSDSRAAEAALVLAYTNATDAAAFVTLLNANALTLTLTNYADLDATGKTAVGSAMLVVNTFADKAAVQSAVTTAIANAKVDSDARAAEAALVLAYTNATDAAAFVTLLNANALALTLTNYTDLDATGKTAVGTAMLAAKPFANKAVVQSAVTTAIANAKVDSDSRAAEAALVLAYTDAANAAAFVTLLNANALALDVTNYAELDATGKTAVGTAMLAVDTFADKAAVQSAVTTAIANAKVDSDARAVEAALVLAYTDAADAAAFVTLLNANALTLILTDYAGLDATGKTAVGSAMLAVNTFANKAAVQSAVTTAIANAKGASDARIANASITTAIGLVPTTKSVVEGTDTNLLTMLNAITGMSATGVTLSLDVTGNANVATNGVITYTGSEVVGNVIVKINKTDGTEQAVTVAVTVPAAAPLTEGDWTYTVADGKATIKGYTGSATVITIPPTLGGYPVTAIGTQAFASKTTLTSVIIPSSVTSIGTSAFNGCKALTSVSIPSGVTSIGDSAFQDCTVLNSVTIPNSVIAIGFMAFVDCTALTSVTIPDSVTSIGAYAFYGCTALTSVTMGKTGTTIGASLMGDSNNKFSTAYGAGGAGTYIGTLAGDWAKYIAVTGITGVATTGTVGTALALAGTVAPVDATNKTIAWTVKNGTATITGTNLTATAAGGVVVTATITNGATASTPYTEDFTITVVAASVSAVGTATAAVGTKTIAYTLTTGTFDTAAGIVIGNWTLGGANVAAITPIITSGVALSDGNTVAWVTVTGTVGAVGSVYTIAPAQAAFSAGFTAPAAATAVSILAVGQAWGGGKVAYFFVSGDLGYVAGQTHGLIAATVDQGNVIWAVAGNQTTYVPAPGATGTAIGTGLANTTAIIAQNGAGITYAAGLCNAYHAAEDGGAKWYLPSNDELHQLFLNKDTIGGFASNYYWSSTESYFSSAVFMNFTTGNGTTGNYNKADMALVRAVRTF